VAAAPVELLQRVPLFADFERGELERLARSFKERTFEAGSTVVGEGKTGAGFFVIESGEATVSSHGDERRKLGAGADRCGGAQPRPLALAHRRRLSRRPSCRSRPDPRAAG